MVIHVPESSEPTLPDPIIHCVPWLLSHPLGYISHLANCVWNVTIANAFSASFSVYRLCFILLWHVTLSLFTLYLVWQHSEVYWVPNLINMTIFFSIVCLTQTLVWKERSKQGFFHGVDKICCILYNNIAWCINSGFCVLLFL